MDQLTECVCSSGVLSLLYGILDVGFVATINRHRQSAIGIHYVLLAVLLLATGLFVQEDLSGAKWQ